MSGIQRRRLHQVFQVWASLSVSALWPTVPLAVGAAENPPPVPRFSMSYVDRSVDPKADFYQFATGAWRKNNPVPSDKSRWAGFDELQERNWWLIRGILVKAAAEALAADHAATLPARPSPSGAWRARSSEANAR